MKSIFSSRTKIKVILAIGVMALFSSYVCAEEAPEKILQSLPDTVKTFIAETPCVYDDPALGASRGYNEPAGTAITIYLYDLGVKDIQDGVSSELIRTAKEEAMGEVREVEKMGFYSNVKVMTDKEIDFGLDAGKTLKMLFVSFSYSVIMEPSSAEVLPTFSDMYLTGLKGYICKIRVSRPEIKKEKEEEIKETIKVLLSTLAR